MEYAANEGSDWRLAMDRWLAKELGHTAFNPNRESQRFIRKHAHAKDIRRLKTRDIVRYIKLLRDIVRLDSKEVAKQSDYVICLWDESAQRGAGTKGEITIAAYFAKPVYLVTAMRLSEVPGWVLGCTTEFFQSFDELKKFLSRRFKRRK
jgi:hypothetical protein